MRTTPDAEAAALAARYRLDAAAVDAALEYIARHLAAGSGASTDELVSGFAAASTAFFERYYGARSAYTGYRTALRQMMRGAAYRHIRSADAGCLAKASDVRPLGKEEA